MAINVTLSKQPSKRAASTAAPSASSKPITLALEPTTTLEQVYREAAAKTRRDVNRLRITTADKKVALDNDPRKTAASVNLKDGDELHWKDLGPQISWKLVFLLEYFGPLFIHPLFFHYGHDLLYKYLPKTYASSAPFGHSKMQIIAYGMVMAHYLKRELETLFVHRFSHATMPFFNVFKNCGHYWGLSGLLLAVPLYGPWYSLRALRGTIQAKDEFLYPLVSVFLFSEVSNLVCHLILRSLRPANDLKKRQIPSGYAFNKITCPNYFFECLAWLSFTVLTMNPFSAIFWLAGTLQMAAWAKKKHRNYKKEFGDKYPKDRWAMIPGIL